VHSVRTRRPPALPEPGRLIKLEGEHGIANVAWKSSPDIIRLPLSTCRVDNFAISSVCSALIFRVVLRNTACIWVFLKNLNAGARAGKVDARVIKHYSLAVPVVPATIH